MSKPTEEQVKQFWEWCGFQYNQPIHLDVDEDHGLLVWGNKSPDGLLSEHSLPIDLNNLFKYAVPFLISSGYDIDLFTEDGYYFGRVRRTSALKWHISTVGYLDPTSALFWALWQVKEVNKNKGGIE